VAKTGEQFLISGNQKFIQGDFQGAIADFNQAIRIDPILPKPTLVGGWLKLTSTTMQGR
jgi:hypothetical protein